MNKDERDEAVAKVLLHEVQKEMKLRETVHKPALRYYFGTGTLTAVSCVAVLGWLLWVVSKWQAPPWAFVIFGIAIVALLEIGRQRERFNALLELMEIEKGKR